jgi:hypothetical protein
MKLSIKLLQSEKSDENGFPLVVRITHGQVRPKKIIGRAWPEHYSEAAQMVLEKHPDYDVLAPRIMELKMKGRKLILSGKYNDPAVVLDEIFKAESSGVTFAEYYATLLAQMKALGAQYEKNNDTRSREKVFGNIKVYENVMAQFGSFVGNLALADLNHAVLLRFKNYQLGLGNSKSTVHQYLRTVRAIYNKGVLFHRLPDSKPFVGLFTGLATKSYASKKKHLTGDAVRVLEGLALPAWRQKYLDMFLLQFYLGGADLKDVYFLTKKQVRKGRVYFERGKTNTGFMIDLKLHPKAAALMAKYPSDDEWQFPWRKDSVGYVSFRRQLQRQLVKIQEEQNAVAEQKKKKTLRVDRADDGNLGIKVARHTFANLGKQLMIDGEVLAELMGHVENSVANFYKDKHSEKVRDEALFKIIG